MIFIVTGLSCLIIAVILPVGSYHLIKKDPQIATFCFRICVFLGVVSIFFLLLAVIDKLEYIRLAIMFN